MKICVAGFRNEANAFCVEMATMKDFPLYRGQEVLELPAVSVAIAPYRGVEWAPAMHADLGPHGVIEHGTYIALRDEILERMKAQMPFDGIYLELVGAMEVEGIGDGETDFLREIRKLVGDDIPIGCFFDTHGNIAPAVADAINIASADRSAPHLDKPERTRAIIGHLVRAIHEGLKPCVELVKLPLMLPGEHAVTRVEPAKSLYAKLYDIDQKPGIMDASIFIGCVWSDSPHGRVSSMVVAERDRALARREALALAQDIWARRAEFGPEVPALPVPETVERAKAFTGGLVVISDSGDNPGAGAAGDQNYVLAEMLRQKVGYGVITGIRDAEAVEMCHRAGEGAEITVTIGGKVNPNYCKPIEVTGKVQELADPDEAVMNVDGIRITLTRGRRSRRPRGSGLDIDRERIIVVKAGYLDGDLHEAADEAILCLSDGPTCQLLETVPYRNIVRPVYPLDPDVEWTPEG